MRRDRRTTHHTANTACSKRRVQMTGQLVPALLQPVVSIASATVMDALWYSLPISNREIHQFQSACCSSQSIAVLHHLGNSSHQPQEQEALAPRSAMQAPPTSMTPAPQPASTHNHCKTAPCHGMAIAESMISSRAVGLCTETALSVTSPPPPAA